MDSGSTIELPHLPQYPVHISLFKDVRNSKFLREQLLAANAEFEYAFVDATTILSENQVLGAVFRAINDMQHNRLRTRNVHSEIVFLLSPNNNIAESFRRFGITDTSGTVLAIKVLSVPNSAPATTDPSSHLASIVEGTRIPFSNDSLSSITDIALVRKIFKLDSASDGGGGKKKGVGGKQVNGMSMGSGVSDEREEMEKVILGMMAIKGS